MISEIDGAKACIPEGKELTAQVLVLGGGLPGVCAAIQAAQLGMTVILVEHRLTLGGNCGPEIGVHPSDAHRFHPYMVSTGVVGKLIEDAAFVNAKTSSDDYHYNISMRWDTVMSKALEKAGVTVLRGHYAHTPYVKDNKIVAVLCEDTMSYRRVLIHVDGYVIDDTGDGNVSERAGASYHIGREAKQTYGESLAPDQADSITMGHSLVSLLRKTSHESLFIPEPDTPAFFKGYGGDGPFCPGDGADFMFWFPTETGGDIDTITDNDLIYKRLRGHLDSAWDRGKNYWKKQQPDSTPDQWEMVWVSPQMGKRESRRFLGDYVLNQNDLEAGRLFEDAIAVGGIAFDIHYPNPENPEYVVVRYHRIPPLYTIPYRSIYSKDVDNLFFASRLLSVSHLAHGSVRLQRTLATIGQAAGAAAALCSRYGVTPRELYKQGRVAELQQILLQWDATIPNIKNNDPRDQAPKAKVTATSQQTWTIPGKPRFDPVHRVVGAELWDFTDRIDKCYVLLRNTSPDQAQIRCQLRHFVPDHIWQSHGERQFFDYYPRHNEAEWGSEHRTRMFRLVAETTIQVPGNFEGYVPISFNAAVQAKNPLTDDDRMAVVLYTEHIGLEIARGDGPLPYIRSIYGLKKLEDGSEAYEVSPDSTFMTILPTPKCAEAEMVINGHNRRFSENPRNMWQPTSLPATLSMVWPSPITAESVQITFDTLERTAWDMPFESHQRVSGHCVKKYRLDLYRCDSLVASHVEDCWHNRLARVDLGSCQFERLELTLLETWNPERMPGVYEIRVY